MTTDPKTSQPMLDLGKPELRQLSPDEIQAITSVANDLRRLADFIETAPQDASYNLPPSFALANAIARFDVIRKRLNKLWKQIARKDGW